MRRWLARRLRRLAYRLDPWPGYDRVRLGIVDESTTSTTGGAGKVTYKFKEA